MATHRFCREELVEAVPARWSMERAVRLQDIDAAGVVFFVRYLEYFHDALMAGLEDAGLRLAEVLSRGVVLAPVKHAEVSYLRPLRFGDRIRVGLVAARVESTQATVGYRLELLPGGEVAAVGQTAHVAVDPRSFERTEFPRELLRALLALTGEDLQPGEVDQER